MATILVVDDERSVREMLGEFLRSHDYEIAEAEDGNGALDWLARHEPDMVILDLQMPGITGLEVLTAIKERYPDLPVVVISGWADEGLAKETLQAGAYEFLTKPLDLAAIAMRLTEKLEIAEPGEP